MEVRNGQQKLGFGALLVSIKPPKIGTPQQQKEYFNRMKNRISDTFDGASIALQASNRKAPIISSLSSDEGAVYKFDGPKKVEESLQKYLQGYFNIHPSLEQKAEIVTENIKAVWGKLKSSV